MNEEEIRRRIEELKAQQGQLVQQANLQFVKLSGSIEALEGLLETEEKPEEGK